MQRFRVRPFGHEQDGVNPFCVNENRIDFGQLGLDRQVRVHDELELAAMSLRQAGQGPEIGPQLWMVRGGSGRFPSEVCVTLLGSLSTPCVFTEYAVK